MKKTIYLLFVCLFISHTSCNKNEALNQNIDSIEASSFQLMEIENAAFNDGMYDAEINDILLKIFVQEEKMKWLMPDMQAGTYTMTIYQDDSDYTLNVVIKESTFNQEAEAYLLDFIEETDIGLTTEQIFELPKESQLQYAKFLEVNRAEILKSIERNTERTVETQRNPTTNTLAVNQSTSFTVFSRDRWNTSGLCVNTGEVYQISASGNWIDLFFLTNADGYSQPILDIVGFLKRAPNHDWFKLIGSIDRQKNYPVGMSGIITATESGTLEFYANDVWCFYWNNIGNVMVTVTRIS